MIEKSLQTLLLSALMAFATNWVAFRRGFFFLPSFKRPLIQLSHLLSVFAIYLGFLFILPSFLRILFLNLSAEEVPSRGLIITLQFFIILGMAFTLFLYTRTEGKAPFRTAFKNPEGSTSTLYDFGFGMISWLIAFPWVALVGQICDLVLYLIFQFESYEQTAVRYLIENLGSPWQTLTALTSIVVIAPVVEELLFRATLQQFLKGKCSVRASILITALAFSLFHFSPTQGLGNLSLIPSLFIFACFLGYVYERQGSIYASIGLHFTFNLVSAIRILLFS